MKFRRLICGSCGATFVVEGAPQAKSCDDCRAYESNQERGRPGFKIPSDSFTPPRDFDPKMLETD